MTIDHRLSLRSRLLAVMSLLGVLLLVVAVLAGLAADVAEPGDRSAPRHHLPGVVDDLVASGPSDHRSRDRRAGLRASPASDRSSQPYTDAVPEVDGGLAEPARPGRRDPGSRPSELDTLTADLDRWRTEAADPEIAAASSRPASIRGIDLVATGTGKALFDPVRADLDGLQDDDRRRPARPTRSAPAPTSGRCATC